MMKRITAQEKKDRLIADWTDLRHQILAAASSLPPAQQEQVFLGDWSVKDLLAHLAGWDEANLEAAQAILEERLPAFYAYIDKDWRSFNARLVAQRRRLSFPELIACLEASHRNLVDFLEALPAGELTKDRGVRYKGYRVLIARLLQTEMDDEREHLRQIQELAGR